MNNFGSLYWWRASQHLGEILTISQLTSHIQLQRGHPVLEILLRGQKLLKPSCGSNANRVLMKPRLPCETAQSASEISPCRLVTEKSEIKQFYLRSSYSIIWMGDSILLVLKPSLDRLRNSTWMFFSTSSLLEVHIRKTFKYAITLAYFTSQPCHARGFQGCFKTLSEYPMGQVPARVGGTDICMLCPEEPVFRNKHPTDLLM